MGKDTQPQKTRNSTVLKTQISRMFSSGGVVCKNDNGVVLWLVRQTVASDLYPKQYWMLPKGWIDDAGPGIPGPIASGKIKADEESLQNTALREVAEEGGVVSKIIKKLGTSLFTYTDPKFGKVLKFVTFYLMEYVSDLPDGHDGETSEVLWLPFDEAKKKLSFSSEKEMLEKAKAEGKGFEPLITLRL